MASSSKFEREFRADLRARGLFFETNCRDLPGTPDIVFRASKIALFVHGCYWHRHDGCQLSGMPKKKVAKWLETFNSVVVRDQVARARLEVDGWKQVVLWECEIKNDRQGCVDRVVAMVKASTWPEP